MTKSDLPYGKPVLAVEGLSISDSQGKALLSEISFSVREGQIVGIAGVEGNGQTQLIEALTGGLRGVGGSGSVQVKGKDIRELDILDIRNLGGILYP
ncbi:ATP-binding cassette domain-containing protein [Paenibacillus rhizoplanae]